MSRTPLYILCLSILLAVLYNPTDSDNVFTISPVQSEPSRVLLLTAHPDDECMFFAPTILNLARQAKEDALSTDAVGQHNDSPISSAELFSLCLSTGDADGLGDIRTAELGRSLDVLGIEPRRRWIIDHPELKDNFTSAWDPDVIADVVRPYVLENRITMILTFDNEGISSHPNHKSLPAGMKHLIRTHPITPLNPVPRIFTLITVPVLTKYSSILAPLLAKYDFCIQSVLMNLERIFEHVYVSLGYPLPPKRVIEPFALPTFVSGMQGYVTALRAMREHRSQLVWFRWLYVAFSRYMWVNGWIEMKAA